MYRWGDAYFVHANSRTNAGIWVASLPAALLPVSSSVEALGATIADSLSASGVDVQVLSSDKVRADASLLRVAKVRSWRALRRSAALCNIWETADAVLVEPTRNGGNTGDGKGYHPLSEQSIAIPVKVSPRELGVAVVAAFDRRC